MALAILEFILFDRSHAKFRIDTGTNPYYKVKVGRSVSDNNGIPWIDEVTHTTPMQKSGTGNYIGNTSREVALPSGYFDRESCYVQLFSCKTPDGKSPAFSKVVKVPVGFKNAVRGDYILSFSQNYYGMTSVAFNNCRLIPHPVGTYSSQQSIEDLLLSGIKAVAPIVLQLLAGTQNNNNSSGKATDTPLQAGVLNNLLESLLKGFSSAAPANISTPKSYTMSGGDDNRFDEDKQEFARPFIFGIDDALLASLAGPLIQQGLQVLPQLLNALNQGKQQKQAATNKLITDILADTNKRLMLQQILASQPIGPNANANINQVLQLLQQAAAAAPADTNAQTAQAKSLSLNGNMVTMLSTGATLVFGPATQVNWNGAKKSVYNKNAPAIFQVKLNVPDPAPKTPLPKAIFKFYFRETGSQKSALEKTFKQKSISANSFIDFLFTKEEIAALPVNSSLMLFAEIRWQTAGNKEVKALGSTEVVMVNNYFVKEQGKTVSEERELNDMKVYRGFWNKIWEAPVIDATSQQKGGIKKYQWELNANLKYGFLLTAAHDSNGLMETKILKAAADPDSLTDKTEGRMKAGIELSVTELNKLCTLWDKQTMLPESKAAAFKSPAFAANNAAEMIYNIKLKGKAGQRGMVWVIPVLKLASITLSKIKTTLPSGQVSETEEEIVQFPVPVAGRVIGLKSA